MKTVTVVGSGIIGLTSAIILQEKGFAVNIVAKEDQSHTLSAKVGAVWFPFEIFPAEKANLWANMAYKRYVEESQNNKAISLIKFISAYNSTTNTHWINSMPEGTVHKAKVCELPTGIDKAYIAEVPLVEPHLYLPYLFAEFERKGGNFSKVCVDTLEELHKLDELVINCTGLGARKLCADNLVYPIRGQILRCKKMMIPSFADSTKQGKLSYALERSNDCILGGTDYRDDWNENPTTTDTEKILRRLEQNGVINKRPEILEEVVGLRPARREVRFGFDPKYPNIFHNYGHGGAGFTVGWGCAMELSHQIASKYNVQD